MTPQTIIHFTFGAVFFLGLGIATYVAFHRQRYSPITKAELLRRSGIRIGFCTLPYLALAWLLQTLNGNDVLFHGFWFWAAVVVVPGLGLALDLSRLPDSTPDDRNAYQGRQATARRSSVV